MSGALREGAARRYDAFMDRTSRACLDAAGVREPQLRADLEFCRRLNAEHGRTYYLSTWLLPPDRRPWVWALYGFARYADEFVDSFTEPDPQRLLEWSARVERQLESGEGEDAPSRALIAAARRFEMDLGEVRAFLESMRMDVTVTSYPTYADLERYMAGSAAAIGVLMLPLLGPAGPDAVAPARRLGEAFQLTNFIRDVGEDLRRGRVYLPLEDLARFGLSPQDLHDAQAAGVTPPAVVDLLRFEITRARMLYADAEPGIAALPPATRPAIRCARILYGEILDAVEALDHRSLHERARVPRSRQARVAAASYAHARLAWARGG